MNKIESKDSRIYVPMTSYKANVQHTLSIRSAYDEHPMKPRGNHEAHPTQIWKYVAMLVMVLVMGVGEGWGGTKRIYCYYGNVTWWANNSAKMCVYAWGSSTLSAASYEMSSTGTANLLYYDLDDSYTSICFFRGLDVDISNKYNQTVDISIGSNNRWNIGTDKTGDNQNVGGMRWTPSPAIDGLIDIHNPHNQAFNGEGEYSVTLSAHSTYQFTILDGTTAYGLNNNVWTSSVSEYSAVSGEYAYRIATAGEGTYTFTWDNTNKKLSVTYPSVSHPSMDYCYLFDHGWSQVYVYLSGSTSGIAGTNSWGTQTFSKVKIGSDYYYYFATGDYTDLMVSDASDANKATGLTPTLGKYQKNISSSWGWRTFSFTVTLDNQSPTTAGATSTTVEFNGTAPAKIESLPSKTAYRFDGYYTLAIGGVQVIDSIGNWKKDVAGYTDADGKWIHDGGTATLYAHWSPRHTVTFVSNGVTVATIYRATGEPMNANPADNGDMPSDPDDDILEGCGANKFVGWSTTDIGGDAITTAPADLFSNASAGEISVNANTTYYAVFADAPEGMALARTVIWSEDWDSGLDSVDCRPGYITGLGGYQIEGAKIKYLSWGNGGDDTKVANGAYAGGSSPELMLGKNGGYLSIDKIPNRGAKTLQLSFLKNENPTLRLDVSGVGYSFPYDLISYTYYKSDGGGLKELTINCGSNPTFKINFVATASINARVDSIVVKVLEDGATNYRTRCPEVEMEMEEGLVTAGTPVFITSAAGKTVRSQDSIHIVGSRLNKSQTVSLVDASGKFALKSRTNTAISTDENGDIDAYGFIYYTPDAGDTEDGLDRLSDITISIAGTVPIEATLDQEVIGRHLPENFVIAVYKNSKWWALPANHTNGTPAPIEIKVDNESTPTKVLTADVNVYTLYGQNAGDYTNGNGHYVRLAMHGQSNAPLFGGSDNKLGKSGNATIGGNLGKGYWWRFEQKNTSVSETTDVKYHLYCPNNSDSYHVRLFTSSGEEKWGQYSGGEDEIRLIPLYAEEIEVSGTEWGKDAIAIEADFGTKSVAKVKASVGETSSGAMSVPAAVGGAYFFDLDGTISFIGHAGERLILDWYNSSDVQVGASWLTIPSIKDAGAATTWSTIASTPTLEDIVVVRTPMAVDGTGAKAKRVVLDGGQVEISAGKELVVAETVRRLTGSGFGATEEEDISIGSTAGAGLGALVMGSHDGTNKATVNFTTLSSGTSGSSASVSQYLGTPFSDATVLSDWYNSWVYGIQYTGHEIGWARVNDGMDPFKGYAVISADGNNHVYWMQGTLVDSETKTIDGLNYQIGAATNPNNENLLANSWMAPIKINAFVEGDFTNADATIYIFNSGSPDNYAINGGSTGTSAGQYSTYTPGTAGDAVIPAMQSFSVYTSGESASVTLDYNKLVYTPAVNGTTPVANRAPQRRTLGEETDKLHLYAYGESGYGDMVYLLAREDFANSFENGFDGRKVFGETVAPQMYAMTMDGNMAINCVPTMEGTVLGFRKGSGDSEYTFSFEYEGAETLYLNDLKAQTSTLIGAESSYTFTAAADDDEARFIISATPIGQMPTEVERQKSKVERQKIIIHGNLFIIRDGRMYHVMGTEVR